MSLRFLIISLIFLTGCGFHGKIIMPDGNIVKWESNRPCTIEKDGFKTDGRGQPLLDIDLPDTNLTKIGG